MKTLVINVGEDINMAEFSAQIKRMYPAMQIMRPNASTRLGKKFTGIGDLKPLHVDGFKIYQREDLYDR